MTLETHPSLRATGQMKVRGGGRERRLLPCLDCRLDWEETEGHLLAWPSHSNAGPRPATGEKCTFKRAPRKLLYLNTDAGTWFYS